MIAKGPDRAAALAEIAWAGRLVFAIEQDGIAAHPAIRADQSIGRDLLAALAGDQHLALGDDRGREVEHERRPPRQRHADAIGGGGKTPLDPGERRHQHAAPGIDEVDRDDALGGGHLGPVADPPDMAGIAQRHGGEPHHLAFLDADGDRLRRDGLAEAELAVDDGEYRRVDHHFDKLVGDDTAVLLHLDIARDAHHPMAVVTGEIGGD